MVYTSKISYTSALSGESMYAILFENNQNVPFDKPILIDVEPPYKILTFGQLKSQILVAANGFKRVLDIQKSDVVAICSPNHINYLSIQHGAVCSGGIVASLHHFAPVEDIVVDLQTIQAKFLITHIDVLDKTVAAAKKVGMDESNILIFGDTGFQGIRAVNDTILHGDQEAEPYQFTAAQMQNDAAFLFYTSGTTGKKKAVVKTQNDLLYNVQASKAYPQYSIINYMNFSHSSALAVMLVAPFYGCSTYLLNHYSLDALCAAIEKHQPSYMSCPPYILSSLIKKDAVEKEYDTSSLKFLSCSGAALKSTLITEAKEKLNIAIYNKYGMTEVLNVFTVTPEIGATGGVGYLNGGFTARIIDEDGQDVPEGQVGELLVKGPSLSPSYYGSQEPIVDADGYFHTGDLFKCNQQGVFSFCDRYKDLIKYYNTHIYPSEIEHVMIEHPKVLDCAVIGVYQPELAAEFPRLYVMLADSEYESEEAVVQELQAYADSQLPENKRVRAGIIIVAALPRTMSGKVQRLLLRQTANAATA